MFRFPSLDITIENNKKLIKKIIELKISEDPFSRLDDAMNLLGNTEQNVVWQSSLASILKSPALIFSLII